MTGASTPEAMSSRSSNSPALEADEPRKKGARGGKRSVTHLSKAQLARKRANDREAQRNIRQRTKEHIENLEKKVKELEAGGRSSSMERVLRRNQELEGEIERLRTQLSSTQSTPSQMHSEISEDIYMPKQELGWVQDSQWHGGVPSHIQQPLESSPEVPVSIAMTSSPYTSDPYHQQARQPVSYEQSGYAPQNTQVWTDPLLFAPQHSHNMPKASSSWSGFHPAFNQPSRFSDLQQSGFTDLVNNPIPTSTFIPTSLYTTSWQSQPPIYCNLATKLKLPVTHIDQLMLSVINTQRHLALTSGAGEEILGPDLPSVHALLNQPGPAKPPSSLTDVMERYSAVLSQRGFALIPETLASFMCMYRFVQWQIHPTQETFKTLYDWQRPRQAQFAIPHAAWMDLPPWAEFREHIIRNQNRYDNLEFQADYASNLSINFPFHPAEALDFENGNIRVSQLLESHVSNIANMSMRRPFADKYPELKDVCRFDQV